MSNANQFFIVRCDRAGVFYAQVESRTGDEAVLRNARRLHSWEGAASLSQVATDGVGPNSRLSVLVDEMTVLGVCELIPVTETAKKSLDSLKVWRV